MIKVMVADGSESAKETLECLGENEDEITVVGFAKDGAEAVIMSRELSPDVIVMDIKLPVMDGQEASRRILCKSPARILILCRAGREDEIHRAFRALEAGAVEIYAKPPFHGTREDFVAWAGGMRQAVSRAHQSRHPVASGMSWFQPPVGTDIDIIGLVASTGGPAALAQILKELPPQGHLAVLAAQHLPSGFNGGLAAWLSEEAGVNVRLAREGAMPVPGEVYLAPEGCHLILQADGSLGTPLSTGGLTPSGNWLLASLAYARGRRAGGAVLSGVGRDGAEGLALIRERGGLALAQDPATCLATGMPKAAMAAANLDSGLDLGELGRCLAELSGKPVYAGMAAGREYAEPARV